MTLDERLRIYLLDVICFVLDSICVLLHNARVRFCAQSSLSCNAIMAHFNTIGVF